MKTSPIPFSFEGALVRVINRADGPWWVLADVCKVLEIVLPQRAASRLDADEKGVHTVNTPGGDQAVTTINESGLYSLVLTSRKPEAKRFKKWVTATVLPAIRKDGLYVSGEEKVATGEMSLEEMTLRVMQGLQAKLDRAQGIVEEHIELLTVNEFFALTHRYARHSERVRVGGAAARLAKLRGITLTKSARTLTDRLGNVIHTEVNVYPRAILEEVDGTVLLAA